jgi:hypothetical protein
VAAITVTPPPLRPQPAPADPAGGLTIDAQARDAVTQLIDRLVAAGALTTP